MNEPDQATIVANVLELADALILGLDTLRPDDLTAEQCVAVISKLSKSKGQQGEALAKVTKSVEGLLELRLAQLVPVKTAAPIGGHTVRSRQGSPKRSEWDNQSLLRAVLDSRRFTATGTLIEETQADKLMHVYGITGASAKLTALKERGLEPNDFCTVTREDKVEVI